MGKFEIDHDGHVVHPSREKQDTGDWLWHWIKIWGMTLGFSWLAYSCMTW